MQGAFVTAHHRLAQGLAALAGGRFGLALIYGPPNFNIVTCTAIAASGAPLIPARPDCLPTLGVQDLLGSVGWP